MSGVKIGGVWKTPAVTYVKVAGVWRTVATVSAKIGGTWRTSTFAGPPAAPVMTYLGSGTTNNGLFEVSNTASGVDYFATNISGGGSATKTTVNGKVRFQLSASPSRWKVEARYAVGAPVSAADYMERKPAQRAEYDQWYNPCGDCNTSVNPNTWTCGCVGGDAGGGQWGVCICRRYPGSYINYGGSGYSWSGSDYTNGSGEWYKVS